MATGLPVGFQQGPDDVKGPEQNSPPNPARIDPGARVIRLSISGRAADTDAPTVDDLLDQIRDYFGVMEEVERALAEDGTNAIEWRVVAAHTNSPIEIVVAPFPRAYATNIDGRADKTVEAASAGLEVLKDRAEDPPFFSDAAILQAGRFFARVTNGLCRTSVKNWRQPKPLEITPEVARAAVKHAEAVRSPPGARPYRELGSLEGYVHRVERDGHGRPIVRIRIRETGRIVKCYVHGLAQEKVEKHQIAEVWEGRRISVSGTIYYKALGHPSHVSAEDVHFYRGRNQLPTHHDIEDVNFTGGLQSENFIERIRNGDVS